MVKFCREYWSDRPQKFCAPALIVHLKGTFDQKLLRCLSAKMFIFCWRTDFKTHIISAQGVEPEKKDQNMTLSLPKILCTCFDSVSGRYFWPKIISTSSGGFLYFWTIRIQKVLVYTVFSRTWTSPLSEAINWPFLCWRQLTFPKNRWRKLTFRGGN